MMGLTHMLLSYVLSLVAVFVLALITDALAPTFDGTKSQIGALKLIAYGSTAGFVGGVFLGAALSYPFYSYPSYAYPSYYPYPYAYPVYSAPVYSAPPVYQQQSQLTLSPSIQRDVCYVGGCYHLEGDGVTVAYQWIWVPIPPAPPPAPPSQ